MSFRLQEGMSSFSETGREGKGIQAVKGLEKLLVVSVL